MECGDHSFLVACTDGVYEALSPGGEVFGYQRWAERLPTLSEYNSAEILKRLLHDVDDHRRGRAPEDDMTAVVVRCSSTLAR